MNIAKIGPLSQVLIIYYFSSSDPQSIWSPCNFPLHFQLWFCHLFFVSFTLHRKVQSSNAPERKKDIFSHPMSLTTVKDYSTSLAVPKSSEFARYLACTRPVLLTSFFNFLRAYASPYTTNCDSPKCPRSWRRRNPWWPRFHVATCNSTWEDKTKTIKTFTLTDDEPSAADFFFCCLRAQNLGPTPA